MICHKTQPNPTLPNECPGYGTKRSDGEVLVLEPCEIRSTSSLKLLLGRLCPEVIVPVRAPSMWEIEVINPLTLCKQKTDVELLLFNNVQIKLLVWEKLETTSQR